MRTYSAKQSWILLCLATLLFLSSLLIALSQRQGSDEISQANRANIAIEIVGEIPHPGIYSFPGEITVKEVLLEAGGIGSGMIGNPHVLDKALNSGSRVVITRDERTVLTIELAHMEPEKCVAFSIPLDLNEVKEEHLTLIPGIGAELAQRIVQYRSKRGGFRKIDELKDVSGIGERKLQDLKRYLIIPGG